MKKMMIVPVMGVGAAAIGFMAGEGTRGKPEAVLSGHFDELSMIPSAFAKDKGEVMPFGYNSPRQPALAPDAPPITYWNIDDIRKAHSELAEKAAKALTQAGSGSSQSFGGGPVHVQTRNFSIFMLYRAHREQPVLSLTKVNRLWADPQTHPEPTTFYVLTHGTS